MYMHAHMHVHMHTRTHTHTHTHSSITASFIRSNAHCTSSLATACTGSKHIFTHSLIRQRVHGRGWKRQAHSRQDLQTQVSQCPTYPLCSYLWNAFSSWKCPSTCNIKEQDTLLLHFWLYWPLKDISLWCYQIFTWNLLCRYVHRFMSWGH